MSRARKTVRVAVAVIGAAALAVGFCPRPTLYGEVPFSTAVLDRHGQLLGLSLAADQQYRLKLRLDEYAPATLDATLLYEDRYFRWHPGFNPASLLRGAWSTYVARARPIGGSTITMQLARMRFALDTRTLRGKLVQIARAVQLERHYSKTQILEAYLNLAPYGGNVAGLGTAARVYFDKPAAELTLPEALALAVIPQNPARRNPATASGYREMAAARARLVARWERKYDLSITTGQQLALPLAVRSAEALPQRAPHFTRDLLARAEGPSASLTTTLDWPLQQLLERQIAHFLDRRSAEGVENASALLVDHRSMEILAAVGSADFFDDHISGQVDGTRAKRSPGSTLKPFVYGLALDRGLIHPMTLLEDAPTRFAAFTPENFDRGFMGPVFARDALVHSRNVPAAELLARVGYRNLHELLARAGVTALKPPEYYGLALALGGSEVTMHELVALYAMLANGGTPRALKTRSDAAELVSPRLLSREASFLVLDMLSANPRPGASVIESAGAGTPVAWKTGTSYAFRDAWTVGVHGPYVLAVWVGNFNGSSNPAFVGRLAAAPLFFEILDALPAPAPAAGLAPSPDLNLRKVAVCASTGDLPGRYCPQTIDSWFIPGVSPITISAVHRAVRVDNATGERACRFDAETTHEEVFEFWPSDLGQQFARAGIGVRSPPPWAADCALDVRAATGRAPEITSPTVGLSYHVRPERADTERLPLAATTDADVKWLFWFVNDSFVARVPRDEAFLWRPEIGDFDVRAVDDLGRSASRPLAVRVAQ